MWIVCVKQRQKMQLRTHSCKMMLLLSLMLLCVSTNSDNTMMFIQSGEDITVKCSCGTSENIVGMYLLHKTGNNVKEKEVVFLRTNSVSIRSKYQNRTRINGSLTDSTITITNLTVDDSGVFRCNYKDQRIHDVGACGMTYTVFVKGLKLIMAHCRRETPPVQTLTFSVTCVICVLAIVIAILLILLILIMYRRVKPSSGMRRQQVNNNDYVYEVMTKKSDAPL
ncbi:uncharacterized protein LOC125004372 [Mugil cephalus]|uniref:uncharacterized protein LOC125004372 n=1 Tax=Mugil cephalus TaxID=48193 RepID=UPI001FB84FB9|nr:uncharacterized protein LOC125004372 [Mugil cephalus]